LKDSCKVLQQKFFKKANFDALRQAISVTPLDMGFDESDVDLGSESWRDVFLNAVESCIPKIKLKDDQDGLMVKLSHY